MESNKENNEIVSVIKEWISVDNELKVLLKETKLRRERKKELSDILVNELRDSDIDGWNTKEGKLEYHTTKVKSSLSKKLLKKALEELIGDNEKVEEMTKFILDSREVKEKEIIKRKIVQ